MTLVIREIDQLKPLTKIIAFQTSKQSTKETQTDLQKTGNKINIPCNVIDYKPTIWLERKDVIWVNKHHYKKTI